MVSLFLFQERRINIYVKAIWAYYLFLSLAVCYLPHTQSLFMKEVQEAFMWNSCRNLLQLIVFPAIFLTMNRDNREHVYNLLIGFAIVDAIFLMITKRGIIEANTFDATIIACLIPICLSRFSKWYILVFKMVALILIIAAAIVIKSRTAGLVIGTIGLIYFFYYFKNMYLKILVALSTIFCAISYYPKLHEDPRIEMWQNMLTWWYQRTNIWIGTGPGGLEWIGLFIEPPKVFAQYRFVLMHNDWLQTMFETGIIGLILLVILYFYVAWKLRKRIDKLSAWFGIGAGMCFYYPMHATVIQIYGLLLMSSCLKLRGRSYQQ